MDKRLNGNIKNPEILGTFGDSGTEFGRVQRMAKIGTWMYSVAQDRLEWSEEVYRIFEIAPEAFSENYEAFMNAVHPEDREAVDEAYRLSLETKEPYSLQHRLLMSDGRIKYVNEECETHLDESGTPVVSVGTVQDVTDYQLLRDAHETHQTLLLQQTKHAQMGQMIDTIAHQWKQPLHQINSILPSLERACLEKTMTPEQLSANLDEIEMLTNHLAQTVERFRQFFHPDDPKSHFDLSGAIKETLALLRGELERQHVAIKVTASGTYEITGDKDSFVQALLSILSNALECFQHREVTGPSLHFDIEQNGTDITLSIADNAGGIPPSMVNKIFDLYFTTKIKGHGTGMGLYIAKMLIEKSMKGTITADNGENGAIFTIFFPMGQEQA